MFWNSSSWDEPEIWPVRMNAKTWSVIETETGDEVASVVFNAATGLWTAALDARLCAGNVNFLTFASDNPESAYFGLIAVNVELAKEALKMFAFLNGRTEIRFDDDGTECEDVECERVVVVNGACVVLAA